MHLVWEEGYRYADAPGLNDLRKDKTKYGDFAHMFILLEEGDCLSYTVRDEVNSLSMGMEYKADEDFVLSISKDGSMPAHRQFLKAARFIHDELSPLDPGIHTVTVRAEKGSCLLKKIIVSSME
jgi:hypothetical protein